VETRSVMTIERKRDTGKPISSGAEVSSLSIGEIAKTVLVAHAKEIRAEAEMAVLRTIPHRPVIAPVCVEAAILFDVMARDVLTASLRIPSGFLVAEGQMQLA
jgi:hypothetical protein